ncbi:MAG: metallophosphoesterase [Actinomycetes bacterium]
MRAEVVIPLAVVAAGVSTVGYAWGYERKAFRLREYDVPVLAPAASPLRVLHISDMHVTPDQPWKVGWVRALAELEPDLVIDTGDNMAHLAALPETLRALEPLLALPGAFVPGSNDFFAPRLKNPLRYLLPDTGRRRHGPRLPWGELRTELGRAGWLDLTHRRTTIDVRDQRVELAGVSDPHIKADKYDRVAGPADAGAVVSIGLTHSPEPRVLDRYVADGFRLMFAGHTHGGQLRLPGYGALVTNCGLDRKRARGLSRYGERGWLHVSAGLGTSPYAPVRFACPPEAALLRLVPAEAADR